ncbi:MAG: hypothetical protein IAE77_26755 [Prosthecobacter sp.]|jgi:hypothetical protein|uniref:hypothetical protein n=1 Tax=Prosthecobacter sp. TaxID=1965333 RepID=UPI001A0E54B1|nr:hypothetical protein [Prosthecobacter sp.]MBE2287086.1 hypothetical protein [Prosthecobacter sp.]
MNTDKPAKISWLYVILWFVALLAMAVIASQPEANRVSRLNTVGFVLGVLATCFALSWTRKTARVIGLVVFGGLASVLIVPWKVRTSSASLRKNYVDSLKTFEGCLYYWGGESRRGIDCSGLVRRGMIDACLKDGVMTADPGLLRHGLSLWWNDTSAKALGDEHDGLTMRLFDSPDLTTLDHAKIQPGDVAVTADGVHTMAYLGDGNWIEADPGKLRVIQVHAPTTSNGWFKVPVRVLRWSLLK